MGWLGCTANAVRAGVPATGLEKAVAGRRRPLARLTSLREPALDGVDSLFQLAPRGAASGIDRNGVDDLHSNGSRPSLPGLADLQAGQRPLANKVRAARKRVNGDDRICST